MDVQGEFQRGQGAGGFDQIFRVAGQAGQDVVDHRRIRRAGSRQVDGLFSVGGAPLGGPFRRGVALLLALA